MQPRLRELGLNEVPTLVRGHAHAPGHLGRRLLCLLGAHTQDGGQSVFYGELALCPLQCPLPRHQSPGSEAAGLGLCAGSGRRCWPGLGGLGGTLSLLPEAGDLGRAGQTGLPSPLAGVVHSHSCPWKRPMGLCIKTSAKLGFPELSETSLVL